MELTRRQLAGLLATLLGGAAGGGLGDIVASGWSNDFITFLVIPTGATTGPRITINVGENGAILVYDNNGELINAIAGEAGTDPASSVSYPAGLSVFNDPPGGSAGFASNTQTSGNSPLLYFASNNGVSVAPHHFRLAAIDASPTLEFGEIIGPTSTADATNSFVGIVLESGQSGGTASGYLIWGELPGFPQYKPLMWGSSTSAVFQGKTLADEPGASYPPAAESWNAVTPASGWTFASVPVTSQIASYRALPDGNVQITGSINYATGSPPSPTTMFTLPAAYRPLENYHAIGIVDSATVTLVTINTNGNVTITAFQGNSLGATPLATLDNITYPLGF